MRLTALLALLLLAACARPLSEVAVAEEAEPVTIEPEVVAEEPSYETGCTPGDDDGIGGTGCKVE